MRIYCVFIPFNVLIFSFLHLSFCMVYTSVYKVEILAKDECNLFHVLNKYIKTWEANPTEIPSVIQRFYEDGIFRESCTDIVGHPIKAFHMMKRMSSQWTNITALIINSNKTDHSVKAEFQSKLGRISYWPTADDINGTMDAILRVWSVYDLDEEDLFKGKIFGFQSKGLTQTDILMLAEHARETEMFKEEIALRKELLKRGTHNREDEFQFTLKLAESYYYSRNAQMASKTLAPLFITEYQRVKEELYRFSNASHALFPAKYSIPTSTNFKELCQGSQKSAKEESKLKCFMRETQIPILRFKEEVLNLHPLVSLYHDVISQQDIIQTKRNAVEKIDGSNIPMIARLKTNQVVTLRGYKFNKISSKLHRRLSTISGLNTETKIKHSNSEYFEIANFGVGGQYVPHHDYFDLPLWECTEDNQVYERAYTRYSGDRIATWMFFLSDVEGGATVFPQIKTRVPVVKGAAVFWYNYKRCGEPDDRIFHGECPVALGSKWVAYKWIRQGGQIFNRRCGPHLSSE